MPRWTGDVRVDMRPWQLRFYHFVRVVIAAFCKVFFRVKVTGLANIPRTGAFILSPVHRSNIDTPLVALMGTRVVRFMGKDSMWKFRLTDWFFTSMGGFPVHRGLPDRDALRTAEQLLAAGYALVVFPEGTRNTGPIVDDLFDGPAYLSTKYQVPIVPVGIGGSEAAMPKQARGIRPVRITIVVGEALVPPPLTESGRVPRSAVRTHTEALQQRLQILFDRAQAQIRKR